MADRMMRPLSCWSAAQRAQVRGVLTDIDDTLTTAGAITADALGALAALRNAGLHVIAVTGRPAEWSAPFALAWPLDAIVAENGAVMLCRGPEGTLDRRYPQDAPMRARNFTRMQAVLAQIEAEVPGAHRARDSAGRECDIAIDHSEFAHLPASVIAQCAAIMRAAGMHASVSSIHINGWYGDHDKWAGACWAVREVLGIDLAGDLDRWVYVGDSTNDEVMFRHFRHSIGVANVARFADRLEYGPSYVTQHERGAGFAEVARCLLDHA
jgi:HAD superfamily hydrolase (TIGR01484 family)